MFGFGNNDTCLHYDNYSYVNLIGYDENSWGLSHTGKCWHRGISYEFTEPFFEKNTLVGCLLNLNNKSIHYYLNGNYLGEAFKNIDTKNLSLYPMVSSTAIDIELELVKSFKIILSLEEICYENIHKLFTCYEKLPLANIFIRNLKKM